MIKFEMVFNKIKKIARDNLLLFLILTSILIGFGVGIGLKRGSWVNTDKVLWFTLPGSLFIRSLQLLIIPVVFISIVTATCSLSAKENLKLTLICIAFCFGTHLIACTIGVLGSLVMIALSKKDKAGQNLLAEISQTLPEPQKTAYDIIADLLRSFIPKNIFKATMNQELTKYVLETTFSNGTVAINEYKRKVVYIEGTNILGVLIFALLVGLSGSVNHDKAAAFREFFKALNEIILTILRWLILMAPIGIASLIVDAILEINDLGESFKSIGLFAGICSATLIIYCVVFLGLMLLVFTRKNPIKYYAYFLEPMLLAFASTSSAVCMSKCITVCKEKVKMDDRISKFTIPFYVTLHADGSAIFITISCIFLANFNNISLNAGEYAIIVIMTSILALCLPSVPSSSIVAILVVLNSLNLSYLNIAILYTVEWLLDRIRTAVNLYSHSFCSVITFELTKNFFLAESSSSVQINQDYENESCKLTDEETTNLEIGVNKNHSKQTSKETIQSKIYDEIEI